MAGSRSEFCIPNSPFDDFHQKKVFENNMVTAAPQDKRPKRGWWWKIPLGVLLFLIVGLTVVLLNIDAIARIQINKALNRYLVTGGKLEAVDVRLVNGSVALDGLTINSPPKYGPHPLMSMDHLKVDVDLLSLFSGKVVVEQVVLKGLSLNVVRDGNGRLSPMELIPAASSAPEPVEDNHETKPPWIPIVHVNSIKVEDMSFRLVDRMLEQDWSAGLGVELAIEGMRFQDILNLDILIDRLDLTLRDILVDQPPGFSRMPLLAVNRIEMASSGIDLSTSRVSVSDVKLDTLSASLERNPDQEINLVKLIESWLPNGEDSNGDAPDLSAADDSVALPATAFELPTLVVDNLELKSVTAQVLDSIDGQPWRAGFESLDVGIKGVEIGDIAQQAISLVSFDLDLKGIAVDQPPGFDMSKLFSLERFTVTSDKTDRSGNELVIKQVQLQGVTSSVIKRADGVTNLQVLNETLLGKDEAAQPSTTESTDKVNDAVPALQPVLFEQISLDGGPITYHDEMIAEEPLRVALDNLSLIITQLRLFSDNSGVDPATASLSFELDQPGELPTAYFGTEAKVGPVGYKGVPNVNAQVRLVGLKLDTLGSLVPPATRTALGATGLDVGATLALDADSINLKAGALTDRGIEYKGLRVQGPLGAPRIEPGPLLTGVLGRVAGGLVNIGGHGLKSGVVIAEGGVAAAKELGSGTVKAGANLGKSLFNTTAGLVTLDKEKVKKGASGTTKGTVGITKDSVKGSGKAAGDSLHSSATELKGQGSVNAWDQAIPGRYQTYMQHARKVLDEMPYPPVTE